jgi:hypothetical protein
MAIADARLRMANEGWIVDEATECIESDASAAKNDAEARSYERAREEGFAFRVELLRRTWVDLDRNVWDEVEIERPLQRPFVEFCDRIIANQRAYLLCSKRATGAIGSTAAIRALVEAGAKAMQRLPPSRGEEYGHLASDLLRHHHPECIDGLRILEDAETAEDSGATGAFD